MFSEISSPILAISDHKVRRILSSVYAVIVPIFLLLFARSLVDDAYIILSYVKNLSQNFQWGMYAGMPANTATSPLNVIALSLTNFFAKDPESSVWILNSLVYLGMYLVVDKIAEKKGLPIYSAFTICLILLSNPWILSSLGLESILVILFFLLCVLSYLNKNPDLFGIHSGFLFLARPDAIVMTIPFWIMGFGNKKYRAAAIGLLVVLPWFLFSWFQLGTLLPDTFFIKKIEKSWGHYSFANGWILYFRNLFLPESIVSILPIFFGLLAACATMREKGFWKKPEVLIFLSGALHFLAYSLLRVPPYHWYYIPSLFCFLFASLCLLLRLNSSKWIRYCLFVWIFLSLSWSLWPKKGDGIFSSEMPIHTNWAKRDHYKAMAEELDRQFYEGTYVRCYCEIGTLTFFSKNVILRNEFTERVDYISLFRYLELNAREFDFLRSAFIRFNFFHIEKVQKRYPNLPSPKYSIGADPPNPNSAVLLGKGSSRWSSEFSLYLWKTEGSPEKDH
ncbi:hypothetical protein EHO60_09040 [Leptospira fletcheri]|uniref:DUF2029 domain-containing protein n=1 Tax=Leptospira fletcheri TaxID=2484981 RepID=A0A4R9GHZ2_9LEPT|nr:hypothetical protein [Leptospira fletcheri]TGK12384.1 hypothetical protein EHO60_09040 [Leptospira fletcheri]